MVFQIESIDVVVFILELQQLRKQWRECSPDEMAETADEEEQHLREATGLRIEIKMAETKQEGGEVGEDEIAVSLLAELQQEQDQEEEFLLKDLAAKVKIGFMLCVLKAFCYRGSYLHLCHLSLSSSIVIIVSLFFRRNFVSKSIIAIVYHHHCHYHRHALSMVVISFTSVNIIFLL